MKYQVMSDSHIENYQNRNMKVTDFIKPTAKTLLLVGDIGSLYKIDQLRAFLGDVCAMFESVFYVAGNHEYYMERGDKPESMEELNRRFLKLGEEISNLHILDRTCVEIGDICIAGCTLWSHPECAVPRKLYGFSKHHYISAHAKDLLFIIDTIEKCRKSGKRLIMMTHYGPTKSIVGTGWEEAMGKLSLYYNNLDPLLNKKFISTWIYGHTHINKDFVTEGGTRVVSNQRGKPKDESATSFSNEFVVTL